jgi:hypothetical protein
MLAGVLDEKTLRKLGVQLVRRIHGTLEDTLLLHGCDVVPLIHLVAFDEVVELLLHAGECPLAVLPHIPDLVELTAEADLIHGFYAHLIEFSDLL